MAFSRPSDEKDVVVSVSVSEERPPPRPTGKVKLMPCPTGTLPQMFAWLFPWRHVHFQHLSPDDQVVLHELEVRFNSVFLHFIERHVDPEIEPIIRKTLLVKLHPRHPRSVSETTFELVSEMCKVLSPKAAKEFFTIPYRWSDYSFPTSTNEQVWFSFKKFEKIESEIREN